ncbi:MAG: ATP-binding cassette domain-containing protein [Dysgonamonadaceae bacterium]|nr:ATP-binding cassette domain-containing protein [Dysgonamonadaceae bacterium]
MKNYLHNNFSLAIEPNRIVAVVGDPNVLTAPTNQWKQKTGMIFSSPTLFPNMTIFRNVLAGYTFNHIRLSKAEQQIIVEESLREADLWDQTKDYLNKKQHILSPVQQQQLCLARALALRPKLLLMDNPTATLDRAATEIFEELILRLKTKYTILIVPQSLAQAARIADEVMYIDDGLLIECSESRSFFLRPKDKRTEQFLNEQLA